MQQTALRVYSKHCLLSSPFGLKEREGKEVKGVPKKIKEVRVHKNKNFIHFIGLEMKGEGKKRLIISFGLEKEKKGTEKVMLVSLSGEGR